jgi:hypothetical protein
MAFSLSLLGNLDAQGIAVQSNKRTLLDAVRAIDSNSDMELEWVEAFLERRIQDSQVDSLTYCILGIAQFRSQNFEKALLSFEKANTLSSAELTRSTIAKFQLLCAINTDNQPLANRLFESLVQATQRESTSLPVRKSYCEWMGEIVGTLDHPEAKSPIDADALAKARKAMLGAAEITLSQAFQHQSSLATTRAERIIEILKRYADVGEDGLKEFEKDQSDQLKKLELILAEAAREKREFTDANQAAAKTLKNQIATVREKVREIEREWSRATPGLPIPIAVPVLPRRELIFVDLFQIRVVTEFINGRRNDFQIQERRPSWDVEAERDAIFQSQMSLYNSQSALFGQYQKNLSEWRRLDADRRKELTDNRKQHEGQLAQLRNELDLLENSKRDNAGGNVDVKKAITQLKLEIQSIRDVLNAAALGKPYAALRTHKIDTWLITEEKNRLLRLFQGQL